MQLLVSESVPPDVLVWTKGWTEWVRADQVPELIAAARAMGLAGPSVPAPALPAPHTERELPRFPDADEATPNMPVDEVLQAQSASARVKGSGKKRFVYVGLLVLLGGALTIGVVRFVDRVPIQTQAVSSVPSVANTQPETDLKCEPLQEPLKLLEWAYPGVRPSFANVPDSRRIAIAYAESRVRALAITLDPATMRLNKVFEEEESNDIVSVTPLSTTNELSFDVVRASDQQPFAKTVDAQVPFRIWMNPWGLVMSRTTAPGVERLWKLPGGTVISVPSIAQHDGGYTVVTRSGVQHASILVGLMDAAGKPQGDLARLNLPTTELGVPDVASNGEQTVLAVAMRPHPNQKYSLVLSAAPVGKAPGEVRTFEVPGAGGQSVESPTLAGLSGGRFVLQWTQGVAEQRQVRMQLLDKELSPLGNTVDISAAHLLGAVNGGLYVNDGLLVSVYFPVREGGHSLWAASFNCAGGS